MPTPDAIPVVLPDGFSDVFQHYHSSMWDPIYAITSRVVAGQAYWKEVKEGRFTYDILLIDARPCEIDACRDCAEEILARFYWREGDDEEEQALHEDVALCVLDNWPELDDDDEDA